MGLIVPQTVKIKISRRTCKYCREKGYKFEKYGDFIEVNVLDLPKGSHEMVKIVCDICGKESEMWYRTVVKCNEKNELITCGSNSCRNKKYEDTCTKKYGKGIINAFQAEEVKEKIKQTNLEHHGCENVMQNKEIQDKIKNTNLERYGCENAMQCKEIQDKAKATCQEKYGGNSAMCSEEIQNKSKTTCLLHWGVNNPNQSQEIKNKKIETCRKNWGVDNPFKSSIIQDKAKATNLERHGVEYPTQNEEIKNKALDSFQFHGTGPCSRAQRYINYILNGTLNKHICGSLADIYIEKENIVIEHDGAGHFLTDKFNGNKTPSKEAILREKNREDKIINNGYRMIRFIATKDRIPSDEVILNLIEGFKNSDFKVIRINFEEGTINRDYEEKWYCNFGELRRITKEDLEQFEK